MVFDCIEFFPFMKVWSRYFSRRTVDGVERLCLSATDKLVLEEERYAEVMKDAHEGIGEFINVEQKNHNSFHKTFALIESRYIYILAWRTIYQI